MEQISIKINDAAAFDAALKESLAEAGDLQIITKDGATVSGKPAVMLTFTVTLPNGHHARAQAVTTLKLLLPVLQALNAKYAADEAYF